MSVRACHLIPHLGPCGGPHTQTAEQMRRSLREHGVVVDIVTFGPSDVETDGRGVFETAQLSGGSSVYRFDVRLFLERGWALRKWLRGHLEQYDVLHIHGMTDASSLVAARQAGRAGVPYVIRPSEALALHDFEAVDTLPGRWFLGTIGRHLIESAAVVHCTSEHERRATRQFGTGTPAIVIPFGLDLADAGETLEGTGKAVPRFRTRHSWIGHAPLIIARLPGQPTWVAELLLEALASLDSPDWGLVFAGVREEEDRLALLRSSAAFGVADRTIALSPLAADEKHSLLADADLAVLATSGDFSGAATGVLAEGVPLILIGEADAYPDLKRAHAGIVAPRELDAVARALGLLLGDPALRRWMGNNGRLWVRERYSWDRVAHRLSSLYRRLSQVGHRSGAHARSLVPSASR